MATIGPSSSVPLLSAFLPFIQNAPSPLLVTPILLMVLIVTLSIFCREITLCFSLPLALLLFFFLPHTLSFPKKETLFTTSALGSYQPSFLLPFRKISKDTCIHVSRITSIQSPGSVFPHWPLNDFFYPIWF